MNEEDLIKLAKSKPLPTTDSSEDGLNEAQRFIIAFQIKSGRCVIRCNILYKIYSEWAVNPISKKSFFRYFAQIFVPNFKKGARCYLLDKSYLDLSMTAHNLKRQA